MGREAMAYAERPAPTARTYLAFVKPHIDLTFVLVAFTGSVLAAARTGAAPWWRAAGAALAVGLLSAGAECWTNLLDRDIDAVMARTRRRPLPSGQLGTRGAGALLPWRPALGRRVVHLVTAYLVVVLAAAIGLAA